MDERVLDVTRLHASILQITVNICHKNRLNLCLNLFYETKYLTV